MPIATRVIAVTESLIPSVQPNNAAKSPIIAVNIPIKIIETIKHNHPKKIIFYLNK